MILWTHLFSLGLADLLECGVARLSTLVLKDDVAKGGDVDAELAGVQIHSFVFPVPDRFSTDLNPRLRENAIPPPCVIIVLKVLRNGIQINVAPCILVPVLSLVAV